MLLNNLFRFEIITAPHLPRQLGFKADSLGNANKIFAAFTNLTINNLTVLL
jgi:hypothetical protein